MGMGFGVRYRTPIGPIRLDYARGLIDVSEGDKGRVHFGIGYMF
jgi:translocation and assembly module TamA